MNDVLLVSAINIRIRVYFVIRSPQNKESSTSNIVRETETNSLILWSL